MIQKNILFDIQYLPYSPVGPPPLLTWAGKGAFLTLPTLYHQVKIFIILYPPSSPDLGANGVSHYSITLSSENIYHVLLSTPPPILAWAGKGMSHYPHYIIKWKYLPYSPVDPPPPLLAWARKGVSHYPHYIISDNIYHTPLLTPPPPSPDLGRKGGVSHITYITLSSENIYDDTANSRQTWKMNPMLSYCWRTTCDAEPRWAQCCLTVVALPVMRLIVTSPTSWECWYCHLTNLTRMMIDWYLPHQPHEHADIFTVISPTSWECLYIDCHLSNLTRMLIDWLSSHQPHENADTLVVISPTSR